MSPSNRTQEKIYHEYGHIKETAHQERIRFYEKNLNAISILQANKFTEISFDYLMSLYFVGAYSQYLERVDAIIDLVIFENIFEVRGQDIYKVLLFKKAQALNKTHNYAACEHILKALLKISPEDEAHEQFFIKNSTIIKRFDGQKIRGISIVLFLLTGIIVAIELLIVRSFYFNLIEWVQLLRNTLFALGLAIMILNEIHIRLQSHKDLNKIKNS